MRRWMMTILSYLKSRKEHIITFQDRIYLRLRVKYFMAENSIGYLPGIA